MKRLYFLRAIPIVSVLCIIDFLSITIYSFFSFKEGGSMGDLLNNRLIFSYIISIMAFISLIYAIVLWHKHDKDPTRFLLLFFCNVFYMPFYYYRIKRLIRNGDCNCKHLKEPYVFKTQKGDKN